MVEPIKPPEKPKNSRIRRVRDRDDIEGLPDVRGERGKYSKYLFKGTEVRLPKSNVAQRFSAQVRAEMPKFMATESPIHASYLARKFVDELRVSTVRGIEDAVTRALNIVRGRAEKQVGHDIPFVRAEQEYVDKLKLMVIRQVQESSTKWEKDVITGLIERGDTSVWRTLVDVEQEAKNAATVAARTLLGQVYNSYLGYLLGREKDAMYLWVNPLDARTTKVCRELVAATSGGVSMSELRGLVKSKSPTGWWSVQNPLLPHMSCRSTFVMVR